MKCKAHVPLEVITSIGSLNERGDKWFKLAAPSGLPVHFLTMVFLSCGKNAAVILTRVVRSTAGASLWIVPVVAMCTN